jgi:hypothetical protein
MRPADHHDTHSALADEDRRMRLLRVLVDAASTAIRTHPLSRAEAEEVVEHLRRKVLALFPDKGETFDLVYRGRFRRLVDGRFGADRS